MPNWLVCPKLSFISGALPDVPLYQPQPKYSPPHTRLQWLRRSLPPFANGLFKFQSASCLVFTTSSSPCFTEYVYALDLPDVPTMFTCEPSESSVIITLAGFSITFTVSALAAPAAVATIKQHTAVAATNKCFI